MLHNQFIPFNNKSHLIWIVGSPRSGTSLITDYIGKYTDHCFNEPWHIYPLGEQFSWNIPTGSVVFKYCANSLYYKDLKKIYPNSKWVHMVRNPLFVLYSMCFPKNDAWPFRSWDDIGCELDDRVRNAFYKWSYLRSAAELIEEAFVVHYENINLNDLSEFLSLPLSNEDFYFENRNSYDQVKFNSMIESLKKFELYDFVVNKI